MFFLSHWGWWWFTVGISATRLKSVGTPQRFFQGCLTTPRSVFDWLPQWMGQTFCKQLSKEHVWDPKTRLRSEFPGLQDWQLSESWLDNFSKKKDFGHDRLFQCPCRNMCSRTLCCACWFLPRSPLAGRRSCDELRYSEYRSDFPFAASHLCVFPLLLAEAPGLVQKAKDRFPWQAMHRAAWSGTEDTRNSGLGFLFGSLGRVDHPMVLAVLHPSLVLLRGCRFPAGKSNSKESKGDLVACSNRWHHGFTDRR